MKKNLIILLIINIAILTYPQNIHTPIDIIPSADSTSSYVSSVNLMGDFNDLVVVVGFSDKNPNYPTITNNEYYPLLGTFPNGTLLKDFVAQHGGSIPADEWYEPAFDYYFSTISGGLYNVNFHFAKSYSNGGIYLSDHPFSYWVNKNGSSNSVIINQYPDILREIADKMYNDNPNIFNDISCIHFIFEGVTNCEFFKLSNGCAGEQ